MFIGLKIIKGGVRMAGAKKKTSADIDKIICTCCGKEKLTKDYYQSQSYLYRHYKLLPICKLCAEDVFTKYKNKYKDDKITIYYFCRLLDLPFSESDFLGAIQHSEKTGWKLYQSYFKQINSFGDVNNVGKSFEDGESLVVKNSEDDSNQGINCDNFESTPDIITFWGKGFSDDELQYLENFYTDFINNYECDSPAQVLLFKNAAKTQLNADKALEQGNIALYDKLMKTLSTILGDSNIKPVQETGANATDQATFGTLIKRWENERPIPEPSEEFRDIDGIRKYISIWFLGHLCKIMGIKNAYSKLYEDEIKKYKVEIPNYEEDEEVIE